MINKVQYYATRRRLEANIGKDPMDVNEVGGSWPIQDEWPTQDQTWYGEWGGDVDAMGKGKAMGKGGYGIGKR